MYYRTITKRSCLLITIGLTSSLTTSANSMTEPGWGHELTEDQKLLPDVGASADFFGCSVALGSVESTRRLLIGARGDNSAAFDAGAAYIFDTVTGIQLDKLTANDAAPSDMFGYSVDVDRVFFYAVGAPFNDDNGANSGSAYIFSAFGAQLNKLLPTDGQINDQFGSSIAVDGGIVVVGAPNAFGNAPNSGAAYIFDAFTGDFIHKLIPSQGASKFGGSVAIDFDNNLVVVGSTGLGNDKPVYIFDMTTGAELLQLEQDPPFLDIVDEHFGYSVSIANGIVAVGAPLTNFTVDAPGAVYLFNANAGNLIEKILPSLPLDGLFGIDVEINNAVLMVGSDTADLFPDGFPGTPTFGAAYFYDVATADLIAKLAPTDPGGLDNYAGAVALDEGFVAIGARRDDDLATDSGSVYMFDLNCPADLTGDFTLDFFDVSALIAAFFAGDPIADLNNDGEFNFFDVSAFLSAFSQPCP
jgi:FG-GAP repeat